MNGKTLIVASMLAVVFESVALTPEDSAILRSVVRRLAPKREWRRSEEPGQQRPGLIDLVSVNGDTNRLANILVELAQTNDAWYAEMAMCQLEKYGTNEQLPFLYSCATNPLVGDRAVKAVLRIEGVTSNTVALAGDYFAIMNPPPPGTTQTRDDVCIKLVDAAWNSSVPTATREYALSAAYAFASNVNQCHQWLDAAFMRHDDSYRYSRRRLSVFRAALFRGVNQYSQSYVTNAINELVAYPEANLPD